MINAKTARYHLARIVAIFVAVGLLVFMFFMTQPVNNEHHHALMTQFAQLQHNQSRLGELVLQLNFSLSNNYDEVNEVMQAISSSIQELKNGDNAVEACRYLPFVKTLLDTEQQIKNKNDALEHFKSNNSLLKNSLLYLPKARDELFAQLDNDQELKSTANQLVELLLLRRISENSFISDDSVYNLMKQLDQDTIRLNPNQQKYITRFIRHATLVATATPEINTLISELISNQDNIEKLIVLYRDYYNQRQQISSLYRWLLLIAVLLLTLYSARTLQNLQLSARQLKLALTAFNHSHDAIIITDKDGIITNTNPAVTRITGYRHDELVGNTIKHLHPNHDDRFYTDIWQRLVEKKQWQGELLNQRKNETPFSELLTISAVETETGEITHYICTLVDITKQKQDAAEIHNLAFYDNLTQLPNRRLLLDLLAHQININKHTQQQSALLFIDLDNFKTLNDTKGHHIGDLMLIEVAQRLKNCQFEQSNLARLGGDEFVVILTNLTIDRSLSAIHAKRVAEKIRSEINRPFNLQGIDYLTTCSIGIRVFDRDVTIEELFKQADTAMYAAKKAGRNQSMFFDPTMQTKLEAYSSLEADIQQALGLNQFELFYQAQINSNDRVVGAEVLLRWRHPKRGLVFPDQFIPLLEETGLIIPIGQWILQTSCLQLKEWQQDKRYSHLVLAVNISGRQLSEPNFTMQLHAILQETQVNPALLKLEITESMLLDNIQEIISIMHNLKTLGIRFSMDDFGTGYSSLQYLKRLPLDQLKIDQSFVRDITQNTSDKAIISTIIAMAQSLQLAIIAEGVETEAQRTLLHHLGCHHYQGYLFSKPIPLSDFMDFLLTHKTELNV